MQKPDWLPKWIWWAKGDAVFELLKQGIGALIAGIGGARLVDQTFQKGFYLALTLLGVFVLIGGVRGKNKRKTEPQEALMIFGAAMLIREECSHILKMYKLLDYDHRARVRKPFLPQSLPAFGEVWDQVAVTLFALNRHWSSFAHRAKFQILSYGGNANGLSAFQLNESSVMIEVIDSLTQLEQYFTTRLDALQTADTRAAFGN